MRWWGRRCKLPLEDLKEKRWYWNLKDEAIQHTFWRTCLGTGLSQETTKWMKTTEHIPETICSIMFLLHSLETEDYVEQPFWGFCSSGMICSIISQKNRHFICTTAKTLKLTAVLSLGLLQCTLHFLTIHDKPWGIKTSLGHLFIS